MRLSSGTGVHISVNPTGIREIVKPFDGDTLPNGLFDKENLVGLLRTCRKRERERSGMKQRCQVVFVPNQLAIIFSELVPVSIPARIAGLNVST